MTSAFIQKQVDWLLGEAETAIPQRDWQFVREAVEAIRALDPEKAYASGLLAAVDRALGAGQPQPTSNQPSPASGPSTPPIPTSL